MDLELVALSTNTASQPRFFYELLHLFKQGCLGHHLALLIGLKESEKQKNLNSKSIFFWIIHQASLYMRLTVIPSVPRAFCLIAMAMRFFSARVSLRAASIFRLTSACSLSASRRFSAKVPIPSSLDTCSSLCKLVIESVPISIYKKRRIDDLCLLSVYMDTAWNKKNLN